MRGWRKDRRGAGVGRRQAWSGGVERLERRELLAVSITEFLTPSQFSPQGITAGPDGNLWFTDAGGEIGVINPTTNAITEFVPPTARSGPGGITAGFDGNLWFTEGGANQIG